MAESVIDSSPEGQVIRRLTLAHINGLEGFGPFAAAVIFASSAGAEPASVEAGATAYVLARLGFNAVFAIASTEPLAVLRTSLFGIGLSATGYLFYLAITAAKY